MKNYILQVLIAFDRMVNVMLGGRQNETISSRSALARKEGRVWGCLLCKFLDKLESDHCNKALITDELDSEQEDKALDDVKK